MRSLLRRFRRELRERGDIAAGDAVVLRDDPVRAPNARAAEVLLRDAFNGRISVTRGPDGLVCGSREEASALRLRAYTRGEEGEVDLLCSSLTAAEIETYFKQATGEGIEVMVPDSPERRMLASLADEFGDVKYGL